MSHSIGLVMAVLGLIVGGCAASARDEGGVLEKKGPLPSASAWSYAVLALPREGQAVPAVWRTATERVVGEIAPAQVGTEPSYAAAVSLYRKLSGTDVPNDFTGEFQLFNLVGAKGWELAGIQVDSAYKNYWFKHR